METILIVPGLHNSGPGHWQTWFENTLTDTRRVEQGDWERACLSEWAARVREAIDAQSEPVWIVAHSFGCLAAASAGLVCASRIRAALLVAPADPDRFGAAAEFPEERLAFPSLVVASNNDPWAKSRVARHWAGVWSSRYRNIGDAGHINVDSGYGPWPEGLRLFQELRQEARAIGD
ncbi:MAG: alpha/beta hydrolase [Candidatus Accumulibacter sp. UW26]|jgi:predicted alpha/beta hydrolase family esterase